MKLVHLALAASLVVGFSGLSCSSSPSGDEGSGGHNGSGGSNSSSGGSNGSGGSGNGSGGSASGGKVGSGGSSSGGSTGSGGSASGGKVGSGGSASGGSGSGGSASGGSGTSTGGSASGGSGTATGGTVGSGGTSAGGGAGGHVAGGGGHVGSGGGSSGGGASGTGTFMQVAALLGSNCATSMCHDGTAHVSLKNDSGLYARIVGGMPNGSMTMSACKTKTLITANDPSSSVISEIVKAAVTGCSDARMPDMCSTTSSNPRACLTTAQIATIDSWISAGAPM